MVYLYCMQCLRYTILVGNPRYAKKSDPQNDEPQRSGWEQKKKKKLKQIPVETKSGLFWDKHICFYTSKHKYSCKNEGSPLTFDL